MSRAPKRRKLSPPEDGERAKSVKAVDEVTRSRKPDVVTAQVLETQSTSASGTLRDDEVLPSVKGLASSDPSIRRKAFITIIEHLRNRDAYSTISSTQWLQLWRGFHVCVYMHDSKNMVSVQNLIRDISQIFAALAEKDVVLCREGQSEAVHWVRDCHAAFWATIVREWPNIDSHRMNKYLLLIRFVVREVFKTALRGLSSLLETDMDQKKQQLKQDVLAPMLEQGPLRPTARMGSGLILHLLDIWTNELEMAINESREENDKEDDAREQDSDSDAKRKQELLILLREPLENIAKGDSGAPKPVRMRAKETIAEFNDRFIPKKD